MAARPRLDLVRQVECFLAVVDERHFGRAADRLGMSQPPLSQGIQRLERLLGRDLFVRGPRGADLTPDGTALLPRARDLLAAARAVLEPVSEAGCRPFRLGLVPQLPAASVTALVEIVRSQDRRVDGRVLATSEAARGLIDGSLDGAVVIHPAVLSGIAAGDVVRLPRAVLVPKHHPYADATAVPLRNLAGTPMAIEPRSHGPAAHDLTADLLGIEGLPLASASAADDRQAVLAVAGGDVLALTADRTLTASGVSRLELIGDPLPLRLRVAWPASRPLGPLADALTASLGCA